jgi:hypothetical protein
VRTRPEASAHFWGRLHRESVHNPLDEDLASLLDEIESYGGFATRPPKPSHRPALELEWSMDGIKLNLIGSVLAFDSARSPALEELRIETSFPADDRTARQLEAKPLANYTKYACKVRGCALTLPDPSTCVPRTYPHTPTRTHPTELAELVLVGRGDGHRIEVSWARFSSLVRSDDPGGWIRHEVV